jgi:hypothetical protein
MLGLAFDENFNNDILRGLLRRCPSLNVVRAQDAGLRSADDAAVLAWAAAESRLLVSHDVSTMVGFAFERVQAGKPMPGLVEVGSELSLATAIADLQLIAECGRTGEWEGQVIYLPLR